MAEAQASTIDYSLEKFIRENRDSGNRDAPFGKVSGRILQIDVDGRIWLRPGAAIAYYGDLKFKRLPTLKTKKIKQAAMRELAPLVSAEGTGQLFCAHHGWHLQLIRLAGETVIVSAEELLAFEDTIDFEMFVVGEGISMSIGGKFAAKLSGEGLLAVAIHGEPLVLPVTPDKPLSTDPHSTLAWSENLTPTLKTDLTWRSLLKHGGGETFQMLFEGEGYVVVQPNDDPAKFSGKKLKKLL